MFARRGKSGIILIFVVVVCVGIGLFLSWKFAEKIVPVPPQTNPTDKIAFAQDLAGEGWIFTPVNPKDPSASGITQIVITKDRAVAAANSSDNNIQKSPDLTGIATYLGLMSNSGLQAAAQAGVNVDPTFLKPRLVWIVSYKGIRQQSSGPPGSEVHFSNELDIVIDAVTGERLLEFVWTR
jgi:hypothetical protein